MISPSGPSGPPGRPSNEKALPAMWEGFLWRDVWFWGWLEEKERERMRARVRRFVEGHDWEGCAGLEVDDRLRVVAAAQALLLGLGLDDDSLFDHVRSIVLYPSPFVVRRPDEEPAALLGEAHADGTVVLSRDDVFRGAWRREADINVVFHEFAHEIDWLSGDADGIPPTATRQEHREWVRLLGEEFARAEGAEARAEPETARYPDLFDAEDLSEFLAFSIEAMFQEPRAFRAERSELQSALAHLLRQDPAYRLRTRTAAALGDAPEGDAELDRVADELPLYVEAVRRFPEFADGWRCLAAAHACRSELPEAVEAFGRVIELRPDDAGARIDRAWIALDAGRRALARGDAERALEIGNEDEGESAREILGELPRR